MLEDWVNLTRSDADRIASQASGRTNVDAVLLEAWRKAPGDPESQVYLWLTDGAPTGITSKLVEPGIFPACAKPADLEPEDVHCDERTFSNYSGVEENQITDAELTAHL